MNIAIIFAGGRGTRMGETDVPKQFLKIGETPVIVRTIGAFNKSNNIDKIVVVTLKEWVDQTWEYVKEYNLDKVEGVVEGGSTGQMSIYNGVSCAVELYGRENIVLINDGVRPFISESDIAKSIDVVKKVGASATFVPATETVAEKGDDCSVDNILDRSKCIFLKAPQGFWLGEFYEFATKAISDGITSFVDSVSLARHYGKKVGLVETSYDNIKITTKKDIAVAEVISESL